MVELSNDTLALLMVAVIVVVIGAVVSLTWMGGPMITGAGSAPAEVTLSITEETTIEVLENVSFGSGTVTDGFTNCTLHSNDSSEPSCWTPGGTYGTGTNDPNDFIIRNLGNIDMKLNISANNTAAQFIGGSTVTPHYNWSFHGCTANCANNATLNAWNAFGAADSQHVVVGNWSAPASMENVTIGVRIRIPDDTTGSKSSAITFTTEVV